MDTGANDYGDCPETTTTVVDPDACTTTTKRQYVDDNGECTHSEITATGC